MKLRRHVVVVGGGFGGLAATKALRRAPVHVTLLDKSNHYLFQPLLYQVAMAGLSPAEVAVPIRSILSRQKNAMVLLAEVTGVDLAAKKVKISDGPDLDYEYLVLAPGARTSYFSHDEWESVAPGLKDLDDAVEIRRRVLVAFEAAEREADPARQRRHLTFVVIGGGPTGVELAGAIAELATFVLARDFRNIRPDATRVVLVEGGERILGGFDSILAARARESLEAMGVEVRTGTRITHIDAEGATCGNARIEATTVLWAAGVRAASLGASLGVPVDRSGRIPVLEDCSIPGYPNVFCIGDAAAFTEPGDDQLLPGVSPVAMQQGRFVARQIDLGLRGLPRERFHYRDKGVMATIGRSRAVARIGGLRLSGFVAWAAWLVLHIVYLIDFRNRILVLIDWAWSYLTYQRGSRLITGHRLHAGSPEAHAATRPRAASAAETAGAPGPERRSQPSP